MERTGGFGRAVAGLLVLWLLLLDIVLLGVAADAFNKYVDLTLKGANGLTSTVVLFALIEGTFLAAACVVGLTHAFHYSPGSVGAAFATSVIAWGVDILALGFVCKEIHVGGQGHLEKAIEALIIIIAFFETIYMLILLGGLHTSKLGVGYNASNPA